MIFKLKKGKHIFILPLYEKAPRLSSPNPTLFWLASLWKTSGGPDYAQLKHSPVLWQQLANNPTAYWGKLWKQLKWSVVNRWKHDPFLACNCIYSCFMVSSLVKVNQFNFPPKPIILILQDMSTSALLLRQMLAAPFMAAMNNLEWSNWCLYEYLCRGLHVL